MNILVFGAGAVGQAVGCMLAASGHTVSMILRERHRVIIDGGGLAVTGLYGDHAVPAGAIRAFTDVSECAGERFNYTLITVKSYDTVTAADSLRMLDHPGLVAVSMQNGCGNLEVVEERFGPERTLGARVITGFEIERPGLVRITVSADAIHIGGFNEGTVPGSARIIADAVNASGLPCTVTQYIRRDLFAKLLYNSALNPLGAALGVHYGALGDNPHARTIMNGVIEEVFAVMKAMNVATYWDTPGEYMEFFYSNQIPATYHHRSSMLQDLERGSRTEIEALTGYVGRQGRIYGIPTPVCDTLSEIVRFLERNRG